MERQGIVIWTGGSFQYMKTENKVYIRQEEDSNLVVLQHSGIVCNAMVRLQRILSETSVSFVHLLYVSFPTT